MCRRVVVVGWTLALTGWATALAQTPPSASTAQERRASWQTHVRLERESIFRVLPWRAVGPAFLGGRVESLAVPKGSPSTIYAGFGSGNLWKTTNNGVTWKPIFDDESTFAIGSIAVDPEDPEVLWVGTGEVLMARSSYAGAGVFKSVDGGESWRNVGLEDSHHIGRVLIDPRDSDTVYVAAIGHNYSYNEERGLYKTTDGGESWERVLYVSERVGVVDVFMDPRDSDTVFAISWERDRKAWNNVEAGEGSGVHKSTDGGKTWRRLAGGLPSGEHVGRQGLAIAPSDPDVMYAIVDNRTPVEPEEDPVRESEAEAGDAALALDTLAELSDEEIVGLDAATLEATLRRYRVTRRHTGESMLRALRAKTISTESLTRHLRNLEKAAQESRPQVVGGELYRSADAGETWVKVHEDPLPTAIGYDFNLVRVAPEDPDEVWILGNYLLHSRDAGKSYRRVEGTLVHLLPHDSTVLHLDHHEMWIDPENGDHLVLGNDGGVHVSWDRGDSWLHLNNIPVGEFYAVDFDMAEPYQIFGGTQDDAAAFGPSTHEHRAGRPDPWRHVYLDRWGGGDSYFTMPDPLDPDLIYYEHQFGRLRRKNMADGSIADIMPQAEIGAEPLRYNWMSPFVISHHNPLTLYFAANRVFKSTNRGDAWVGISPDLSTDPGPERRGDVPFGTITTLSESRLQPGLLYVGTDDGNVSMTRGDGATWQVIRGDLPAKWVSRVVASRHVLGRVYLSMTGYREDDFRTYLYASENHGAEWRSIAGDLPQESVNVIREDPRNPEVLYVGTDLGVYASLDRGARWYSLTSGLPTTPVHDVRIHPREREIVIGTHGRSVFVADARPIQDTTPEVLAQTVHLFDVRDARLGRRRSGAGEWEQEPDDEAVIYYYLREASDEVALEVLDDAGEVVRALDATGHAGVNRVTWDLTRDRPQDPREQEAAPTRVERGQYRIELRFGGRTVYQGVEVR